MKTAATIARLILGILFLVFGLDYFFDFVPGIVSLPHLTKHADNYLDSLNKAEYFFPILKTIEILGGLGLIINRYTALFIIGLFPVTFNILMFDIFLGPQLLVLGVVMFGLNLFLLFVYQRYYKFLFTFSPRI
ncbi:DoxX family membrane protein [Mucilaginibacter glaciei]|uniref:DoxX family membrane protein n=1 Tax=Mucilaginibacter glaciei TaxID=2772109 RepID=A0A926S1M5_9SPHI|nr:DoxX family membrane protein [Mucilaginibacter glaciei]MBD1392967.1 DoxX family membrane protein [Mucilaginibacter glaciei]